MTTRRAAGRVLLLTLLPGPLGAGRVGAGAGAGAGGEDPEPSLSLSDLAPYRAALEPKSKPKPGATAPAEPVTFRDLWDHPEAHRGRRVRCEGRVVRRFRQGAFGTFPPLTEVWAVSAAGDPFCLVFPTPAAAGPDPAPGASVRFEGTFLRRLRYQGGDADRLAPLVVGDRPPAVTTPAPPRPTRPPPGLAPPGAGLTRFEWPLGLLAAAVLALALARRHLLGPSRPPVRPRGDEEPPPEFVDSS